MLDKNYVIEHLDEVIERLNTRNGDYSYLRQLPELVNKRNAAIKERDDLKAMRNSASKQIGALMAQKKIEEANELKKKVSESKDKIAADDKLALELDEEIRQMLLKTPNLPDPSLPIGLMILSIKLLNTGEHLETSRLKALNLNLIGT